MTIIFATAADQAHAFAPQGIVADAEAGDEAARQLLAADIRSFERLWAMSDDELVAHLRQIRDAEIVAAQARDWDEVSGWEYARCEVYAVLNHREAMADAAYEATQVGGHVQPLTHRPFAALA